VARSTDTLKPMGWTQVKGGLNRSASSHEEWGDKNTNRHSRLSHKHERDTYSFKRIVHRKWTFKILSSFIHDQKRRLWKSLGPKLTLTPLAFTVETFFKISSFFLFGFSKLHFFLFTNNANVLKFWTQLFPFPCQIFTHSHRCLNELKRKKLFYYIQGAFEMFST